MANPSASSRFVSVNLNKSYGQHSHHQSSSYGSSRTRANGHGGAGMVVLSRPRSSQKAGPKLSVPPPLNLPSLRKEHEKYDSLGSGGGPAGGGSSGHGSRPMSSGMGWTKPATVALKEKEPFAEQTLEGFDQGLRSVDGFSTESSVYMPPSARSGMVAPVSTQVHPTAEKVAVLRGDDFPSLRATLSSTSGPSQKHKENLNQSQEQKRFAGGMSSEQKDASHLSLVDMHTQFHPSNSGIGIGNGLGENGNETRNFSGSRAADQTRKQEEYFPGPLPLVRLNLRSDWADDERYVGSIQHNRNRADSAQSSVSKSSFSSGGNDMLLNFGRKKHPLPKSEKALLEDPFLKDFGPSSFDGRDLFPAGLVGVVKKKKDVLKQTDFHDPVRESFEAELERVQRMQEQERQRIIEEQERALEIVCREEEERLRQAREQEESQRRLEEEAREAAWRAEQERIEALRKAEEQRLAKEEEKQRIILEEERRKQAAKQKLLELEERIAKRQAESAKGDNSSPVVVDERMPGRVAKKDAPRPTDVGDWDESERMVERILTSASFDSSTVNRPFEMGSRPQLSRDVSSTFEDRGKPVNSWRRDVYDNWSSPTFYIQNNDNGYSSPRRDSSISGKPFMRKDYNSGTGFMSSRTYYKGGISEAHHDEYAHVKGQRWNQSGDGDHFSRNTEIDSDFHENFVDRFGDGWTQNRSHGYPFPSYPEHPYSNSESDGPYALGRSRYSLRQPRVLPPPTLASVHKSYRNGNEHSGTSAFLEDEIQYGQAAKDDSSMPTDYDSENHGQPEVVNTQLVNLENEDHKADTTPWCDSQSSLSVSSPPSSPTLLSHDDFDESGGSLVILTSGEGKNGPLSALENESVSIPVRAQNENVGSSSCGVSTGDDDEWTAENNDQFQEQEEYDEDEDYQEEDEVHEGDDNVNLNQEFEDMHLQEKGVPQMMDNLVLGFDEGVQVGMPNEDFERTSKNEETSFLAQQGSGGTLVEHVSFDHACTDGKTLQPVEDSSQLNLNCSSSVFEESEKPPQDLVIQPGNFQSSGASESLVNVETSNNCLSANHSIPTSVAIAPHSSSDQSVMPNVAAAPSQADLPIKLQFGLFSGPSLIPSPVPALQIGSIQMPLYLHPQVGPSLSHMHPSQPPLFQFGQLRYTSPISQGILPLGPQSVPFVQPNVSSGFSFNSNPGGCLPVQTGSDTSDRFIKNERVHSVDDQPSNSNHFPQGSVPSGIVENMAGVKQGHVVPHDGNNSTTTATGFQLDKMGNQNFVGNSSNISSNSKQSENRPRMRDLSLHSVSKERDLMEPNEQFPVSGGRGKKYVFAVKSSGSKSSGPAPRVSRPESGGFMRKPRRNIQHIEFRIRESAEKRQLVLTDQFGSDNKSNINRRGTPMSGRTGPRKSLANKLVKQTVESVPENLHEIDSGSRADKANGKESTKTQSISHSGQSTLKRNLCSEEDVDAPLQSGIIRVFEQPGIEAPSDEDDFIEVRSKRQMLNDRREQREKEIKAKSRVAKMPRKPRPTSQSTVALSNPSKGSISTEVANSMRSDFTTSEDHGMAKVDVSSGFNSSILSQALAPIGMPPLKIDAQIDLRSQTSRSLQTSLQAASGGEKGLGSGVIFESKNEVMALAQTQQLDLQASVGDLTNAVNEPGMPTSSLLTKEKAFSSAASPINSLLAGEKIQFGAVTSAAVLPPSSHAVSHGIGPAHSSRSDIQISYDLAGSNNDCNLFFDKEKRGNESCGQLEDCDAEAEAEAAASAVAVAAISSDEIVGNGLGACSVPISDAKSFVAADTDRVAAGEAREQQLAGQSRSDEPLSVSLPADLSVETQPISLWPPLPSTQNSSSQMISHFSGPTNFSSGPPHFPFYEMNPMMGGPVFAFGPHDESASTAQTQPQKSTTSASRPIGSWQQCHSGVDSFYCPPTGFTGPFMTPPGGVPGVQAPPHMVVYNHFAPLGQFGQVGLSFMGTTYIPSGKQPDWKHNPTSSAVGAGEGDINNMNMASLQRSPANMPSPIQHLAPGSPLLPLASPLAMFDVSPFQPSPEMSVQARWPHVPNSSLPSIPVSAPLQQEGGVHQLSHGPSVDQLINIKRFTSSAASTSSDGDRNFPRAADVSVNQLPDELGLVDTSISEGVNASLQRGVNKIPSMTTITDSAKDDIQNGNGNSSNKQNASSTFKSQSSQHNTMANQQYDHSSGYANYQRGGGLSHRNNAGGEWSHRRMGFQGRNQSLGAQKSSSSSKVKQIYVAKQTMGGASTVS